MTFLETVDHSLWRSQPVSEHYPVPVAISLPTKLELEQAITEKIAQDFTEQQKFIRGYLRPLFDYSPVTIEPLLRQIQN